MPQKCHKRANILNPLVKTLLWHNVYQSDKKQTVLIDGTSPNYGFKLDAWIVDRSDWERTTRNASCCAGSEISVPGFLELEHTRSRNSNTHQRAGSIRSIQVDVNHFTEVKRHDQVKMYRVHWKK